VIGNAGLPISLTDLRRIIRQIGQHDVRFEVKIFATFALQFP
jgi:hypothetical protein